MAQRADISRRHLRTLFRSVIEAWVLARRALWTIDDAWQPAQLLDIIKCHRSGEREWVRLTDVSPRVTSFDRGVEYELVPGRRYLPRDEVFDVEQVFTIMRLEFPGITRARVRTLLFRAERTNEIGRKKRGAYAAPRYGWNFGEQRKDMLWEDEYFDVEWPKIKRQWDRQLDAMLVHVLLPDQLVYRKARALDMSDRAFHYAVNAALDRVAERVELDDELLRYRRAAVQR